ncbi:MAG: DUF1805 domain-containing protein [Candidatus Omnitrophica bacterium]|nr:DUF1805 domain-containing protein [Candidatus Omnitrophota bacterium]MDD5236561.1 DUF1805 domain-containing protein [Candidatus Omnitrophota bacterium]MDD5610212.1 DUF1805 domain-containing protein [Candidatus Omnitrophota bacterium]
MVKYKKIKVGEKYIEALWVKLLSKNFILLRGSKGYAMCGYLDLKTAEKFKDAAIKIVGVANFRQALNAKVHSLTQPARKLGIYAGQPIKEALKIIV